MTSFWILLFIICLPKTGATGEKTADHGQGKIQQITTTIPTMLFLKPTISRLHDSRRFWKQGHKTFSGFIKARERPPGKKTKERNGRRESRESQENRGGGRTKKKERRGKQRVRPLYFVFSSSSRAPSLAATAPGSGHCKREIQGDRGRVDRNREKKKRAGEQTRGDGEGKEKRTKGRRNREQIVY
jgi:hypothetical protein